MIYFQAPHAATDGIQRVNGCLGGNQVVQFQFCHIQGIDSRILDYHLICIYDTDQIYPLGLNFDAFRSLIDL